jgi:hypothetical protein
MKYRIAKRNEANMTCLQGFVNTTYDHIVSVLGKPIGSGDKTTAEWIINFNGTVATIYDYKEKSTPKQLHDWHIGGHNDKVIELVGQLLNCAARDWRA